ncbi:Ran-specific GTPase-activating protein 30 [Coemansia sp. RSA 989]|nr:Ran-specific GTPase-activating protein 30 [Coemansia sp. RSA 989]
MDELFSNLAIQTVQLVGKAAFGAAGTIALQTEVEQLRELFETKLRIITPAIDLVDIISARGHSTMSSVLHLTMSLRQDILAFSAKLVKLDQMLNELGPIKQPQQKNEPSLVSLFRRTQTPEAQSHGIVVLNNSIVSDLRMLLRKIDDAVPLLNLALATSGTHLGNALPTDISPSRLMQASALISRASLWFDVCQPNANCTKEIMVGQPYSLRLYSLFLGSVRPKSKQDFTWKEEFAKCMVALWRVSSRSSTDILTDDICYELRILEDQNDGRYHEADALADSQPSWVAQMKSKLATDVRPGRSIKIQLKDIAGLHYTSAGSLLNIEESKSPVLVLSVEDSRSGDVTAVGSGLNIANGGALASPEKITTKWYALEVDIRTCYESTASDSESESSRSSSSSSSETDGEADSVYRHAESNNSEDADSSSSDSNSSYDSSSYASDKSESSIDELEDQNAQSESSSSQGKQDAEEINRLAASVASLCTIDTEPETSKHGKENIEPAPLPADSFSDLNAAYSEYHQPAEFLANEWHMCTLSLLEYTIRLASIEISEQISHLEVPDEKLRLYLLNTASPGSASLRTGLVPGEQMLGSPPYPVMDAVTPAVGGRGISPVHAHVARHQRTPSMLGSPAVRAAKRSQSRVTQLFDTPHK